MPGEAAADAASRFAYALMHGINLSGLKASHPPSCGSSIYYDALLSC